MRRKIQLKFYNTKINKVSMENVFQEHSKWFEQEKSIAVLNMHKEIQICCVKRTTIHSIK